MYFPLICGSLLLLLTGDQCNMVFVNLPSFICSMWSYHLITKYSRITFSDETTMSRKWVTWLIINGF
jgi:hypothetical protein